MKRRYIHGTTEANNALTLPNGRFSIDTEKKALRFHDGETPGGYEVVGEQAIEALGPGEQNLQAGDMDEGYFAEIAGGSIEGVPTYGDLVAEVGLSAGSLTNDESSPWLKCALDGKVLLVARRCVKKTPSWEDLDDSNLVYGDVEVTFGAFTYKVRLLTGAESDPSEQDEQTTSESLAPASFDVSEWNRLIYHFHEEAVGDWESYTGSDMDIMGGVDDNASTWCQETWVEESDRAVTRGRQGIKDYNYATKTSDVWLRVWRPVLELVEGSS